MQSVILELGWSLLKSMLQTFLSIILNVKHLITTTIKQVSQLLIKIWNYGNQNERQRFINIKKRNLKVQTSLNKKKMKKSVKSLLPYTVVQKKN
jgi:hypothetical protein